MPLVTLSLAEPLAAAAEIVLGLPIDTPEQRFLGHAAEGAEAKVVTALNSGQPLLVLSAAAGSSPTVALRFEEAPGRFPDWIFEPTGGRHERPSPALVDLMAEIAPASLALPDRVEAIIRHVEARFTYGHRDVGLGDDVEAMPALDCDVHLGTCVDTHSYGVAAFRAAGIEAAYVSGLFFPEGETASRPGHCWMVVRADGAPHHWDVSHFLKYGLGPVRPLLNPKPGFRYAMSIGRDLRLAGPEGIVEFTRLSGFNLLTGPRAGEKLDTLATVSERAGLRSAA